RAVQEALARELAEPVLTYALRGERGGSGRVFQATPGPYWLPRVGSRNQAAHLRLLTQAVELSRQPVERHPAALAALQAGAAELPPMTGLLVPAIAKLIEANLRAQAHLRAAVVAVAAERYRLRHQRWPATIDDLAKDGLLPEVPADPYDGQPLRWRRHPDGAVAYAVGADRADNGGAIDRDDPRAPNTDVGFRLWDPAARRQDLPPAAPRPLAGFAPGKQ